MKHPFIHFLLIILLAGPTFAKTSVWKVSKEGTSIYIGGTCHVLRASDYPLPPEFDIAYAAADTLVFEINPAAVKDPSFAMKLLAASTYTDGRTLQSVLSTQSYEALAAQAEKSGLPMHMLNGLKPGMALMMITVQELLKIGVNSTGVDLYYFNKAKKDNKSVQSLETLEFQTDMIATLGEGLEDKMVAYSLKDLDKTKELFETLIQAWRSGDLATLEKAFVTEMAQYPEIYHKLLVDRNNLWIPQIERYLGTPDIELILVGAAHTAGPDGLLAQLESKGYTVEHLQKAPR